METEYLDSYILGYVSYVYNLRGYRGVSYVYMANSKPAFMRLSRNILDFLIKFVDKNWVSIRRKNWGSFE